MSPLHVEYNAYNKQSSNFYIFYNMNNKIQVTEQSVPDIKEHASQCIHDGVKHAENKYTNPVIRIFMHPDIHELLTPDKYDGSIKKMEGYRVIISEYATLRVIVCGTDAKDIKRNRTVVRI